MEQNTIEMIRRRMEEELELAIGSSDEQKIQSDLDSFNGWVGSGQAGRCPVNLSAYIRGLDVNLDEPDDVANKDTTLLMVEPVLVDEFAAVISIETPESQPEAHQDAEMDGAEVFMEEPVMDVVQERIRDDIRKIREYVNNSEWRLALALADVTLGQAAGSLRESILTLKQAATEGLSRELEDLVGKGNAARAERNTENARRYYQMALELDPESRLAHAGLNALTDFNQEEENRRLAAALRERRDIQRLGTAVYSAEALDQEGRLAGNLFDLLEKARKYYDETRKNMGDITTMMRYGDLRAKNKAVANINDAINKGQTVWHDSTSDRYGPIQQMLKQAQDEFEKSSADVTQAEIVYADKNKAIHPSLVRKRLETTLWEPESGQGGGRKPAPLFERYRRDLEEKLSEVEQFVAAERTAGEKCEQARGMQDPVEQLKLLLEARSIFRNFQGVAELIQQAKLSAVRIIKSQVNEYRETAITSMLNHDFESARRLLAKANERADAWPEEHIPDDVQASKKVIESTWKNLTDEENLWNEYNRLTATIRTHIANPENRAAGVNLYQQLRADARFIGYSELKTLAAEVDQFRGVGDRLADAENAARRGDWNEVYDITRRVLDEGSAGRMAENFRNLNSNALTEINISKIQEMLANDDIKEANFLLTQTLKAENDQGQERGRTLSKRLEIEQDIVRRAAIASNSGFKILYEKALDVVGMKGEPVFDIYINPTLSLLRARPRANGIAGSLEIRRAINQLKNNQADADTDPDELVGLSERHLLELLQTKGVRERITALRLFRFIGGIEVGDKETDWPDFALSLHTGEAKKSARLISKSLRRDILVPLQNTNTAINLSDVQLKELAEHSAYLRQANLLESESERVSAGWAEVNWGKRQALRAESSGNWNESLRIWQDMDRYYPGDIAVKEGRYRARIQSAILNANTVGDGEEALNILQARLAEPGMENAWELIMARVDIFKEMERFDDAFSALNQLKHFARGMADDARDQFLDKCVAKQNEVESQKIIVDATAQAKDEFAQNKFLGALKILQSAIESLGPGFTTGLLSLQRQYYNAASETLLAQFNTEKQQVTTEGRRNAAQCLIELRAIETLIKVPDVSRPSAAFVGDLIPHLNTAADNAILASRQFNPVASTLASSIQEIKRHLFLMQSVMESIKNLDSGNHIKIAELAAEIDRQGTIKARLLNVSTSLRRVGEDRNLWDDAISKKNLRPVELMVQQIRDFGLVNMPEVVELERRLAETRELLNLFIQLEGDIRKLFFGSEDFKQVAEKIAASTVLPNARMDDVPWSATSNDDYTNIRNVYGKYLRIPDIYGTQDMAGWDEIAAQANQREEEFNQFSEWDGDVAHLMDLAEIALNAATASGASPRIEQKSAWENARDRVDKTRQKILVDFHASSPVAGIPGISARSKKAGNLLKQAQTRYNVVKRWDHDVQRNIAEIDAWLGLNPFPTADELNGAVKLRDRIALEKLIRRGEERGHASEDERRRLTAYKKTLQEWITDDDRPDPFWKRLLGL